MFKNLILIEYYTIYLTNKKKWYLLKKKKIHLVKKIKILKKYALKCFNNAHRFLILKLQIYGNN
jgi:hypothetical protein